MKNLENRKQSIIILGTIAAIVFPTLLYLGMSFVKVSFDFSCWDIEDRENLVLVSMIWFVLVISVCYLIVDDPF